MSEHILPLLARLVGNVRKQSERRHIYEEVPVKRSDVAREHLSLIHISQTAYDEAVADNVYDRIQVVNVESQDENINSYFVDEMTDQIVQDMIDRLGYTETQAYKALYQGGLTIESTQDPDIQNICDEEVNNLENYPTDPKVSFSYRVSIQSPDGTISNYSQQTMLSYYQKSNKNYSINFASEDDARAAIEQYKICLLYTSFAYFLFVRP